MNISDVAKSVWELSFIHSVFCLTTGPKPPPKRCLHTVRSRASSFKWEYPLLSLRSSSSFLCFLPRLLATSISPFIFPSITKELVEEKNVSSPTGPDWGECCLETTRPWCKGEQKRETTPFAITGIKQSCGRWVPRYFTDDQKIEFSELLFDIYNRNTLYSSNNTS